MKHGRPDYNRIQDPLGLIPAEEPVFLLRGADGAAPHVVRAWADRAEMMKASPEIIAGARQQAHEMEQWQRAQRRRDGKEDLTVTRGKIPDLPSPEAAEQIAIEADAVHRLIYGDHSAPGPVGILRAPRYPSGPTFAIDEDVADALAEKGIDVPESVPVVGAGSTTFDSFELAGSEGPFMDMVDTLLAGVESAMRAAVREGRRVTGRFERSWRRVPPAVAVGQLAQVEQKDGGVTFHIQVQPRDTAALDQAWRLEHGVAPPVLLTRPDSRLTGQAEREALFEERWQITAMPNTRYEFSGTSQAALDYAQQLRDAGAKEVTIARLPHPDADPDVVAPPVDPNPGGINWETIRLMVDSHITALLGAGAIKLRMRVRLGSQLITAAFDLPAPPAGMRRERGRIIAGRQLGTYLDLPLFLHPGDNAGVQVQAVRNDVSIDHGAELP